MRLGDGVISARTEWVATGNTPNRQPGSARGTVFRDRLDRVRGATRKIATRRRQQLTEADLIPPNGKNEKRTHRTPYGADRDSVRTAAFGFSWVVRNRRSRPFNAS